VSYVSCAQRRLNGGLYVNPLRLQELLQLSLEDDKDALGFGGTSRAIEPFHLAPEHTHSFPLFVASLFGWSSVSVDSTLLCAHARFGLGMCSHAALPYQG
jgi:hypothetical protein